MASRTLRAAVLALVLATALPAYALAVAVSTNCQGGGVLFTRGTATNWQDHTYAGALAHYWYMGAQFQSTNWGFRVGPQTGTVVGPNLSGASAICVF